MPSPARAETTLIGLSKFLGPLLSLLGVLCALASSLLYGIAANLRTKQPLAEMSAIATAGIQQIISGIALSIFCLAAPASMHLASARHTLAPLNSLGATRGPDLSAGVRTPPPLVRRFDVNWHAFERWRRDKCQRYRSGYARRLRKCGSVPRSVPAFKNLMIYSPVNRFRKFRLKGSGSCGYCLAGSGFGSYCISPLPNDQSSRLTSMRLITTSSFLILSVFCKPSAIRLKNAFLTSTLRPCSHVI